jgi:hypothetical protein
MDADKTRAWISAERFAPFLEQADGNRALAFDLYLWHARISGASLTTLHHFEVALRNAIDRQLGAGQPQAPVERSWLLDPSTLSPQGIAKARAVLARLEREGYPREIHESSRHFRFPSGRVCSHAATSSYGKRDFASLSLAWACGARFSNRLPTCTCGGTASPTTTRCSVRTSNAGLKR